MLKLLYLDIEESLQSGDWITPMSVNKIFSDSIENVKGSPKEPNYYTLEGNGINLLDENKKFYEYNDYIGLYCGHSYISFILQPSDLYTFAKGLFFRFYGDCCKEIYITYKDPTGDIGYGWVSKPGENCCLKFNESLLSKSTYIWLRMDAYDNQIIKIASLMYGNVEVFDKFTSYNLTEEINVLSDNLPYNAFECSVISDIQPLKKPIDIYSNGYYGRYYISSAKKVGKNIYQISAKNEVGKLEDVPYDDWHLTMDLSYFISRVKEISGIEITEPSGTAYFTLGHIPVKSARYCLCGLCFAYGLIVHNSRQKGITLLPIPTEVTSNITSNRIIGTATFENSDIVTKAEVQYVLGYDLIDKTFTLEKTGKFYFSDPPLDSVSTSTSEAYISNGSLNYVEFYGTAPASFTGKKVEFTKTVRTITNPDAETTGENQKSYNSFDLTGRILLSSGEETDSELPPIYVTSDISRDNDISKYIRSKGKAKAKIRLRGEKCGDLVTIETLYNGTIQGIITKMNISFGYEDIADIEIQEWS